MERGLRGREEKKTGSERMEGGRKRRQKSGDGRWGAAVMCALGMLRPALLKNPGKRGSFKKSWPNTLNSI